MVDAWSQTHVNATRISSCTMRVVPMNAIVANIAFKSTTNATVWTEGNVWKIFADYTVMEWETAPRAIAKMGFVPQAMIASALMVSWKTKMTHVHRWMTHASTKQLKIVQGWMQRRRSRVACSVVASMAYARMKINVFALEATKWVIQRPTNVFHIVQQIVWVIFSECNRLVYRYHCMHAAVRHWTSCTQDNLLNFSWIVEWILLRTRAMFMWSRLSCWIQWIRLEYLLSRLQRRFGEWRMR